MPDSIFISNSKQIVSYSTACVIHDQYILATYHAIHRSEQIFVFYMNTYHKARKLHIIPEYDLVILIADTAQFQEFDLLNTFINEANLELKGYAQNHNNLSNINVNIIKADEHAYNNVTNLAYFIAGSMGHGYSGSALIYDGKLAGILFQTDRINNNTTALPSKLIIAIIDRIRSNSCWPGIAQIQLKAGVLPDKLNEHKIVNNKIYIYGMLLNWKIMVDYINNINLTYVDSPVEYKVSYVAQPEHKTKILIWNQVIFQYIPANLTSKELEEINRSGIRCKNAVVITDIISPNIDNIYIHEYIHKRIFKINDHHITNINDIVMLPKKNNIIEFEANIKCWF
jgi:hypothetical protein